jgi:hypothetical protein
LKIGRLTSPLLSYSSPEALSLKQYSINDL